MDDEREPITTTIAETENYLAWRADEPDGESTYHLELNNVTLHFFKEEWQEFLDLIETIVDEELQEFIEGGLPHRAQSSFFYQERQVCYSAGIMVAAFQTASSPDCDQVQNQRFESRESHAQPGILSEDRALV